MAGGTHVWHLMEDKEMEMNDVEFDPHAGIALTDEESAYIRGNRTPVVGSLLMSTSKYLNSPNFRDLYAQMGLRRVGREVSAAYLIPDVNKAMDEVTDYPAVLARIAAARKRLPEFDQWLEERFVSDIQPEHIKDCAPGTLGSWIYDFITNSGMKLDIMFLGEPKNDFQYINKRRMQTHDILHMVTGLDTSLVGEACLNIANVMSEANYFGDDELFGDLNRGAIFLATTNLMRNACHYPSVVPTQLEGFARGYALGSKQKKPLFMINWEPYFDWKIEDIREEFSFQDGPPDGSWTWTGSAAMDAE